jgi:hypothetical protein
MVSTVFINGLKALGIVRTAIGARKVRLDADFCGRFFDWLLRGCFLKESLNKSQAT